MHAFTIYASLLFALTTQASIANTVDCININADLKQLKMLAETGKYRTIVKNEQKLTFNFQNTQNYHEYLAYAKAKIIAENPKATLKCAIETGVTTALNKSKNELTVTDLIAPFELEAANNKQAILLIHGLTDSPFLLHDLASFYYHKGFSVRTLLLPGHGTAPEALIDVDYKDWQKATHYAISKTLEDFEQVYLGGFSTGGALILDNLLTTSNSLDKLKGVMLWAPASKAKSSAAWAAQFADWIPFLDYTHKGADIDFAKYESFPLNAAAQVYSLMAKLTDKLSDAQTIPDIPIFTVTSEVDTTIDTTTTITILNKWHNASTRSTQKQDTIFYFGESTSLNALPTSYVKILPTCDNPTFCDQIINIAHTAVTNAPTNEHYGWQGSYRNCETSFGTEHYDRCKTTNKVILGETTRKNVEKYPDLQRLTFNPNFEQMTQAIAHFISTTQ